jgi:hypothetical protein
LARAASHVPAATRTNPAAQFAPQWTPGEIDAGRFDSYLTLREEAEGAPKY